MHLGLVFEVVVDVMAQAPRLGQHVNGDEAGALGAALAAALRQLPVSGPNYRKIDKNKAK